MYYKSLSWNDIPVLVLFVWEYLGRCWYKQGATEP